MTALSKEAVTFETEDYYVRVTNISQGSDLPAKTLYGIFNKISGVREGQSEQLWFAVLAAYSLQASLARALEDIKSGALLQQSPEIGLTPPKMN